MIPLIGFLLAMQETFFCMIPLIGFLLAMQETFDWLNIWSDVLALLPDFDWFFLPKYKL